MLLGKIMLRQHGNSHPLRKLVKKISIYAVLIGIGMQACFAGAAAADMVEQGKEEARKDLRSPTAKITSVHRAELFNCGMRDGPAAKACEIQAEGKRVAADDQAKQARDLAGAAPPASEEERKKAAKHGRRIAKISVGMDKARITKEDKQARAQCNELKGEERKICNVEVASRTADAHRDAQSTYDRSVAKAKGINMR